MHIFLGLPTHSGTAMVATIGTLLQFQKAVLARGWTLDFEFFSNSLITEVRNVIVADFLWRGADVLMMIDSDQGAHADTLLKLLDSGHPVAGVMYPRRKFDLERVRKQPPAGIDQQLHRGATYVGALMPINESGTDFTIVNGFAKALYVGAGLLAVRRNVFDALKTAAPELKGKGFPAQDWPEERYADNWGFFNLLDQDDPPLRLSEDYAFCHRWRTACGGDVWADVVSETIHVGQFGYRGAYIEYLKANYTVKRT